MNALICDIDKGCKRTKTEPNNDVIEYDQGGSKRNT